MGGGRGAAAAGGGCGGGGAGFALGDGDGLGFGGAIACLSGDGFGNGGARDLLAWALACMRARNAERDLLVGGLGGEAVDTSPMCRGGVGESPTAAVSSPDRSDAARALGRRRRQENKATWQKLDSWPQVGFGAG